MLILKREMVFVSPQELARILMALPPLPPVVPITKEQMEDAKAISIDSLIVPNTGKTLNKYQSSNFLFPSLL